MSYDIYLADPVTRVPIELEEAHYMRVGDVFYAIDWSRWGAEVKEYRISMLQQKRDKTWRIRAKDTQSDYQVNWAYDDYREQAYSTREAAEAALKAREQDGCMDKAQRRSTHDGVQQLRSRCALPDSRRRVEIRTILRALRRTSL